MRKTENRLRRNFFNSRNGGLKRRKTREFGEGESGTP